MSRIPSSIRRPLSEFLGLPTLIALGFLVLAFVVYAFEESSVGWLQLLRTVMRQHVFGNPQSTSDILSTIASSTITVTSITFSLILLAIQQSASSMTFQRQASGDPKALRRAQGGD